ncbi:MAG TPA: M28 family peptidase [Candidatus Moranbacteria bacterium]|nr:M28 family peptidase [Candidatus Moranbacteria bacterium]HSA08434.1 M28 family peptidase [Candidatus Moranbacteria bacterium]
MDFDKEYFIKIVEDIGKKSRLAGSKGESEAFDYIKKHIKEKIGGKIIFQKYKILTWEESEKSMFLINGENIKCQAIYYSPSSKIKGKLEYFGENNYEKDNEFDVFCVRDKQKNISAFINLSKNFKKPFYYCNGEANYLIPSLIVGSEYLDIIKKNLGENVEIRIKTKFLIKKSINLIHKLSNRKGKLKLVICAHVDTVPHSKGILDDASGIAAAMVLSQEIKKIKLPFDVWIVYFGAEENSMFGSKFFIDTLTDKEKKSINYVVSVDGIGMGDNVSVYVEEDYFPQIKSAFKKIEDKLILSSMDDSVDISDHYYFKLSGIDSCLIEVKINDFYYHSSEANDIKNLNIGMCSDTILSVFNYIKNIQFKSPDIYFDKKENSILKKIMPFLQKK